MYVASLPRGSDTAAIRHVVTGVPTLDALVLPADEQPGASGWLMGALGELRRELFLHTELQVLVSVNAAELDRAVAEMSRLLVELQLGESLVARVDGMVPTRALGRMRADGEAFNHRSTSRPLPPGATILSGQVPLSAAPLVESSATSSRFIVTTRAAAGSLALAAVYESLGLLPTDWDRLATIATMARVVERPLDLAPLWLEVEAKQPRLVGTDQLTANALQARIRDEQQQLAVASASPDVAIRLEGVAAVWQTAGRFALTGVAGGPPSRISDLELCYLSQGSDKQEHWPTTISRFDVDCNVVIQTAATWAS